MILGFTYQVSKNKWKILAGLIVIILVIIGLIWLRPCEKPKLDNTPIPSKVDRAFPPDQFTKVNVIEDDYTPAEKLNPLHKKTRAETLLADKPPGTEVAEFTAVGVNRIYRTQEGLYYIENDSGITGITVYKKPLPLFGLEYRPEIALTCDFSTIGLGVRLDVLRLWKLHSGPGIGINTDKDTWAGLGICYNIWRNVNIGAYCGKVIMKPGFNYGISAGISIQ
jgi:hypothetical protein